MKTILVIAAHPDDEVLGCGGTIAKHVSSGDVVHVLILAEGATSRDERRDCKKRTSELSGLVNSAHKANDLLGVRTLKMHNFPDNRMDSIDLLDIVKVIENQIYRIQPDIIYTHHAGDVNVDHRRTHEAVVTACRPLPQQCVKTLLFFEVPSSTEWQTAGSAQLFSPNWFVDVSLSLALKLEALKIYLPEMREWPHARSIKAVEHLACWRGASVGCEAAEAFVLGRQFA